MGRAAREQSLRDVAGAACAARRDDVDEKVREALERLRDGWRRKSAQLKDKLATAQGTDLAGRRRRRRRHQGGAPQVDGADAGAAQCGGPAQEQARSAVIVLASVEARRQGGAGCRRHGGSDRRIKAGDLVGSVAAQVGGKGGGRADFAQAGGSNPAALAAALAGVERVGARKLGAERPPHQPPFDAATGAIALL